jgi:hypothetical protein
MKKVISMLAVSVMIGALCAGCEKADTTAPEGTERSKTTGQPKAGEPTTKENKAANWAPETSKKPTTRGATDPEDHSGHNHGPGGHDHN